MLSRYGRHIFTTALITPRGLIEGLHGMPSGTTITNELDSCYNEVLAHSIYYLSDGAISLTPVVTQGDDAVLKLRVHDDKLLRTFNASPSAIGEYISNLYAQLLMEVNPKKNRISKDECEFLKRLHLRDVLPSYRSYI